MEGSHLDNPELAYLVESASDARDARVFVPPATSSPIVDESELEEPAVSSFYDMRILTDPQDRKRVEQENYSCPICMSLLHTPIELDCGHRFCMSCINQTVSGGIRTCPTCRQAYKNSIRSRNVQRLIAGLKVMCVNSPKCAWKGTQGQLSTHCERECTAVEREICPKCDNKRVEKGKLEMHLATECLLRSVPCPDCKTGLAARDLANHKQTECLLRMVSCPNKCPIGSLPSHLLDSHLDRCLNHKTLCTHPGCYETVRREYLKDHNTSRNAFHCKLSDLSLEKGVHLGTTGMIKPCKRARQSDKLRHIELFGALPACHQEAAECDESEPSETTHRPLKRRKLGLEEEKAQETCVASRWIAHLHLPYTDAKVYKIRKECLLTLKAELEQNVVTSSDLLADLYLNGYGVVHVDWNRSFEVARLGFAGGNTNCLLYIYICLFYGFGCIVDKSTARALLAPYSSSPVARCLLESADIPLALLQEKVASLRCFHNHSTLVFLIRCPNESAADPSHGVRLARTGHAGAQAWLGQHSRHLLYTVPDHKAIATAAVHSRHPDVLVEVAKDAMRRDEDNIAPADNETRERGLLCLNYIDMLRDAADQGQTEAQCLLGAIYAGEYSGRTANSKTMSLTALDALREQRNIERARWYLCHASDSGDDEAVTLLANLDRAIARDRMFVGVRDLDRF